MYFVLLSFIPNPVLTAAPLICVFTSSVAVTHRPVSTHPLHVLYTLVVFKIFPFGLVSLLSSKIENANWAKKRPQPVVALEKQLQGEISCCGCF